MGDTLDLKLVIKHLANGTLGENLCIICLSELTSGYEHIHTKICREDHEFSVADVLKLLSEIQIPEDDNYNVCLNCFKTASSAYKFYMLSRQSNEILNFYADEIVSNLDAITLPEELSHSSLCFNLPEIIINNPIYTENVNKKNKQNENVNAKTIKKEKVPLKTENIDNDIIIIIQDDGKPLFYKTHEDGTLVLLNESEQKKYEQRFYNSVPHVKERKKRTPMEYRQCPYCTVKYRFVAKLKDHMKTQHDVELYICKVCKATTEDMQEYHSHLKTHTNVHQCAICSMVFKRRDTIISHLKWHDKMKNVSKTEGAHICEVCGVVLTSESRLREHCDNKHHKRHTCYYCGRMYKGRLSLEAHIRKHEMQNKMKTDSTKAQPKSEENKRKHMCVTCGKCLVDERALLWHQRLHSDDRPYPCDVCGKRFVSLNRRNQHARCAHSAPARRCPLCPALFHLRSMVNTHLKKVHLKAHKRRNRVSKHQHVFWRTEPVPIQELSVDIQGDILELQQAARLNALSELETNEDFYFLPQQNRKESVLPPA